MPLKRKKDGSFSVSSKSHVRAGLDRIAEIEKEADKLQTKIEKKCKAEMDGLEALAFERAGLKESIEKFVKDKGDYEDDSIKVTRVQGHRRTWNVAKLESIVPRGVFKNLVKMEVIPAKVDEYVRKGKLDRKKIAPAFEETPNAPYVKWTPKTDSSDRAEQEADGLAEALS